MSTKEQVWSQDDNSRKEFKQRSFVNKEVSINMPVFPIIWQEIKKKEWNIVVITKVEFKQKFDKKYKRLRIGWC